MKKMLGLLILLGIVGVGSVMIQASAPGPIPIDSANYNEEYEYWKEHHDYMDEFHSKNGGFMDRRHGRCGRGRGHHGMMRRNNNRGY
ncbi:MAG: hypothetical protein GX366_06990 [Epulopiscium sp.]|nr:hypothetical protein [Candidatus Epulonipiscium sp.]